MQDFVLFDDAQASPERPSSRLLTGSVARWSAATPDEVLPAFSRLEDELAQGRQVALFVAYEAAGALCGLPVHAAGDGWPLVEALAFPKASAMDAAAVEQWLRERIAALPPAQASQPCGLARLRAGIERADYDAALDRIAQRLRAGETYQINFTWPLHGLAYGHPLALYAALRQRQPTRYCCLARLAGRWVLSLSPELFFAREGALLRARPMKGTAPRATDADADARIASALAADPKNRAENLMILDLLRNDLGRLARPGTVRVPERFRVEPYRTVWQMTSSVEAELGGGPRWAELFAALFPCGSVTGAPKRSSMGIIRALEPSPRGLYTGAIGYIDPSGADDGPRAVFNVPIRTLQLDDTPQAGEAAGTRAMRLGVGGGIVIDSDPAGEWAECWDKLRFVTDHDPGFGLIETFAAVWPAQRDRIERHFARLAASAAFFGYGCDLPRLRDAIARAHAGFAADDADRVAPPHETAWDAAVRMLAPAAWRTRLVLRKSGDFDLDVGPMAPPPRQPVRLLVAAETLDGDDPFLRHKTTHRARYDAAWRAAEAQGAFDQLFFNHRGELCEGARSSVLVRLDGRWWTPALACGLLPGVARQHLLDAGAVHERVLVRADLDRAQALAVANSLRGVLRARLVADG